jgi:uncharacterized hydantoinase/oxoprolinase family protein
MSKRIIMRIEIAPASKTRLDQFCEDTGMTKLAAVSRLIDWFCEQDETVQAIVQHLFPSAIEADVAKLILQRMVGEKGATHTPNGNGRRARHTMLRALAANA